MYVYLESTLNYKLLIISLMQYLQVEVALICRKQCKTVERYSEIESKEQIKADIQKYIDEHGMVSSCCYKLNGDIVIFLKNDDYIMTGSAKALADSQFKKKAS